MTGPDGSLYLADRDNHRIRRITPDGTITTVAGTGVRGFSGNGGPALQAELTSPVYIAADTAGNLIIGESGTCRLRRIAADGTISVFAGTGEAGSSGDGGPALDATFNLGAVAAGPDGSVYVSNRYRLRRISPNGIVTTVAGDGVNDHTGDGGTAVNARLTGVGDIAVSSQ